MQQLGNPFFGGTRVKKTGFDIRRNDIATKKDGDIKGQLFDSWKNA